MPVLKLIKFGRPFGDNDALAKRDFSGIAVERKPIALANSFIADHHVAILLVEAEALTTNETSFAKLTRNDSGMSGAATGRGQDSISHRISFNVLGRGFRSH